MEKDTNVSSTVKEGGERYIFLYDDESRAELLRVFERFASNPVLSFSIEDEFLLSEGICRRTKAQLDREWFSAIVVPQLEIGLPL